MTVVKTERFIFSAKEARLWNSMVSFITEVGHSTEDDKIASDADYIRTVLERFWSNYVSGISD